MYLTIVVTCVLDFLLHTAHKPKKKKLWRAAGRHLERMQIYLHI